MWNSVKEWRDDCRDQHQLNQSISQQCTEILKQELSPPPIWRSFVYKKIAKRFQPDYAYYKLEDEYFKCGDVNDGDARCYQTHHDEDGAVGDSRFWATSEVVDFKSWDRRSVVEKGRSFRMAGGYKRIHWRIPKLAEADYNGANEYAGPSLPEDLKDTKEWSFEKFLEAVHEVEDELGWIHHHPHGTKASRGLRRTLLERRIDNMIESVECSAICGTPDPSACGCCEGCCREGIRCQCDGEIIYGGMKNYTAYMEEQGRIAERESVERKVVERKRINPIREAGREYKDGLMYDADGEVIPSRDRLWAMFAEPAELDPPEEVDWSLLTEHLRCRYEEKVSVAHSGNGSHERLRVEVNEPAADVWRRGCYCQAPVPHTMISLGDLILFDGPTWMFWDLLSTWTAVLMMFVYWEWMLERDLRRRGDERRRRKQMMASKVKVKSD